MDERAASLTSKPVTVERLESRMLLSVATFAPPAHYRFNTTPRDTTLADFNGHGTFAPVVYYVSGGDHPTGLVVGDFNQDGLTDVAVSRGREHDVSVLLNNPAAPATFGLPNFFPTAGNVSAITLGDFNRDGILDL